VPTDVTEAAPSKPVPKTGANGRQAEKSSATRQTILKAGVQCFWELGYANTSTNIIADRAGISRGAMVHHFPKKRDLLEAIVEYIMEQRIKSFTSQVRKLKQEHPDAEALDIYWDHLNTRLFTAYHELVVASRTDADLKAVMRKATQKFEKEWFENVQEVFPEWQGLGEMYQLAMDVTQFTMEGMALNRLAHDAKLRQERVRNLLRALNNELLDYGTRGSTCSRLNDVLDAIKEERSQDEPGE